MTVCSVSRRMSAGSCLGSESTPHPPQGGSFDVGRIGEFQFQAMIAAGNSGRSLFQHSAGILATCVPACLAESIRPVRSALSTGGAADSTGRHDQARFERAVFLAGKSLDALLLQLIEARPDGVNTGVLNDKAVRLCVDLERLRETGGARSSGSVLAEIACVHLRHLPLDDLVTLRSHVQNSEHASLHTLTATGRTVLDAIATALDDHVAWLATREPVGALADLCQTLSKGGTVGYDDVPEQLRVLHAGMSMLRDKSHARGGVPLGTQWRRNHDAQAEDRARFMTPSVRQLHDVSLACIEDMLTRACAPAPVGDALSQSARCGRERLDLNRVLAALGGAVRAEKVVRLQRCMNSATARFDALLEKVHGIFKQAARPRGMAGPSENAMHSATDKDPVEQFTDQNANERALSMLRHALARILPGFLQPEESMQNRVPSAFGPVQVRAPRQSEAQSQAQSQARRQSQPQSEAQFQTQSQSQAQTQTQTQAQTQAQTQTQTQNQTRSFRHPGQGLSAQHRAAMPDAYTRQHADAALRAGLHDASQIFRGIIERLDMSPDLIELHPDDLHDDLMLNALKETRLWHSMHEDADLRPRAFSAV